ncbi:MAG: transposase [Candidatus Heimdallarchaeota archaeon]|nr:transposase [Candidatus Heimdallarchaeota archaeon]MCK4770526.1 transposase [Candidatus Heimdallarchaeota archaeon]
MKEKEKEKQEDLKSDNKKHEKREDVKSTPHAPLVKGFETIPIRIKTELMSAQECERLKRITARDTRIIRDYLRIIYHNEERKVLYKGKLKPLIQSNGKVNKSLLDCLALTTSKKSKEHKIRSSVPHDLKKRYSHCSHDEFQECRNKATWTYESYRKLRSISTKEINRPQIRTRIPRQINKGSEGRGTLQVHYDPENTETKLCLKLRDKLDPKPKGEKAYPKLLLPLAYSPYHEKKLNPSDIKIVELVYHSKTKQWWAHFNKTYAVPSYQSSNPPAVVGVDLGIKKTAVAVVLNHTGKVTMDEILFLVNKERQAKILHLEKRISSIQNALDTKLQASQSHHQLNVKLSQLRNRRQSVTEQELGHAVNQLVDFILHLKQRYNLFVSIGYPKDIRNGNKHGRANKTLRRQLQRWCFRYFITKLKFKLHKQGFESHHVVAVCEKDTSQTCSRCFTTLTTRSSQGRFVCCQCNYELNADLNGARNMAKRLIKYVLKPSGKFKEKHVLRDYLSGDFHDLNNKYGGFHPLGQWLEYSPGDTSFL